MGIYFIFDAVQNYLSDSYGEYASSAISAQGFVRNALAASFPLFSTQMFNNLTIPYAGLLLACLLAIAIPLPFILIKYGARIRAKSRYAAANTGAAGAGGADEGPVMGARKSGDLEKGARRRKPEASQQQQQQQQQPEQQQGDSVPTSGTQTRAASPTTSDNKEKEHFEHTH